MKRLLTVTIVALIPACGPGPEEPTSEAGSEGAMTEAPIRSELPPPPAAEGFDEDELESAREQIAKLEAATSEDQVVAALSDLGWIGHPVAIDPLSAYIDDPRKRVYETAIGALEDIGGPDSARALGGIFAVEGQEAAKLRAIEALHYIGIDARDEVTDALVAALGDPSPAVNKDARLALIHLADPTIGARLLELYKDETTDPRIRGALANILRTLGDTSIPAS